MNDNALATQPPAVVVISRRQLVKYIQKLNVRNGDVLAVKADSYSAKEEVLRGLADALGRAGRKDIVIVVVDSFTELAVLGEKEMNAQGWYKLPALRKLIHTKADTEPAQEAVDGQERG